MRVLVLERVIVFDVVGVHVLVKLAVLDLVWEGVGVTLLVFDGVPVRVLLLLNEPDRDGVWLGVGVLELDCDGVLLNDPVILPVLVTEVVLEDVFDGVPVRVLLLVPEVDCVTVWLGVGVLDFVWLGLPPIVTDGVCVPVRVLLIVWLVVRVLLTEPVFDGVPVRVLLLVPELLGVTVWLGVGVLDGVVVILLLLLRVIVIELVTVGVFVIVLEVLRVWLTLKLLVLDGVREEVDVLDGVEVELLVLEIVCVAELEDVRLTVLEAVDVELGVWDTVLDEVNVPLLEDVGEIVAEGVFDLEDDPLEDTDTLSILLIELDDIELPDTDCTSLVVTDGELEVDSIELDDNALVVGSIDEELELDEYPVIVAISEFEAIVLVVTLPELEVIGDHDRPAEVELESIAAVVTDTDVDPLLDNGPLVDAEIEPNILKDELRLAIVDGVCITLKLGVTVVVFVNKGLLLVEAVGVNTLLIVL